MIREPIYKTGNLVVAKLTLFIDFRFWFFKYLLMGGLIVAYFFMSSETLAERKTYQCKHVLLRIFSSHVGGDDRWISFHSHPIDPHCGLCTWISRELG